MRRGLSFAVLMLAAMSPPTVEVLLPYDKLLWGAHEKAARKIYREERDAGEWFDVGGEA